MLYEGAVRIGATDGPDALYSDYVIFVNQENSAIPNLTLPLTLN